MRKKHTTNTIKRITAHFFRGHRLDQSNDSMPIIDLDSWKNILQAVANSPVELDKLREGQLSRYISINNNIYFLLFYNPATRNLQNDFFHDDNDFVYGVIFKRRDVNWPIIENGHGLLREINTKGANESIAEQAYFILDMRNSLLIFVGNQRSANSSILAKYFSAIANYYENDSESNEANIFINFRFIFNPDAKQDFERMRIIKRIDLQLSGGDFLDFISTQNNVSSVEEAIYASINAAKSFGGRTVRLSLVLNNAEEPSLLKRCMMNFQEKILFFRAEKETRPSRAKNICSITGIIDENTRILNLLDDELIVKTDIEITGKYRQWYDTFAKLIECYEAKRTSLLKLFAAQTFC